MGRSSVDRTVELVLSENRIATRVLGAELQAPLVDGLVRHLDSTLGQEIFGITRAEAEAVAEPDGVADDACRKSVPRVEGCCVLHDRTLSLRGPNLTVPQTDSTSSSAPRTGTHRRDDPSLDKVAPFQLSSRSCCKFALLSV